MERSGSKGYVWARVSFSLQATGGAAVQVDQSTEGVAAAMVQRRPTTGRPALLHCEWARLTTHTCTHAHIHTIHTIILFLKKAELGEKDHACMGGVAKWPVFGMLLITWQFTLCQCEQTIFQHPNTNSFAAEVGKGWGSYMSCVWHVHLQFFVSAC